MTSSRAAGRVLPSLAALAGLFAGLPAALAVLAGWPLPRRLPDPSAVGEALRNGWAPDGPFVLKALALVCWLAWAQLAACVIVEFTWALRIRRSAPRVPLAGWVQPFVARLVTAALLTTGHAAALDAAVAPIRPVLAIASTGTASTATTSRPTATRVAPIALARTAPAATRPTYRVQRHDTLWDLAARHLGDPLRWHELYALNQGVAQPGGRALDDPHWIYPGWTLTFPSDAVNLPTTPAPTPTPPGEPQNANDELHSHQAHGEAATAQAGNRAPSAAPSAPTTAPAPTSEDPQANKHAPAERPAHGIRPARHHGFPAGVALGLPVLGGAALLAALERNRKRQRATRPPGHDLRRPPPETEPLERRLRTIEPGDAAAWVDGTMRLLTAALAACDPPQRRQPIAVRAGALGLELLLDTPCPQAPDQFETIDSGAAWRLAASVTLEDLHSHQDVAAAAPALITVGDTDDGPLLLNLEAAGCLSVEGDTDMVASFLTGALLELAVAPWAPGLPIVEVQATGGLPPMENVQSLATVEEACELAAKLANAHITELGDHHSSLDARVAAPHGEGCHPTVITIGPGTANTEQLAALAGAAANTKGSPLVLAAGPVPGAAWRLVLTHDATAVLEPLGMVVRYAVTPDGITDATALLRTSVTEPVQRHHTANPDSQDPIPESTGDVEVRILGPVEVEGWTLPSGRRRLTEIVAYLATHRRHPVHTDILRTAIWPLDDRGTEITYASFKQAMSRTRAALGETPDGTKHLGDAIDGTYRLGPGVDCDWDRFRRLVRAADHSASADAIELLRQALEQVRGAPFADVLPGTYTWAWSEQIVSDIEVAVTDAAAILAKLALEANDPVTANWACEQGLLAVPEHETLFHLKMEAAANVGDIDTLNHVYRQARRATQSIDDLDEPSEDTVRLYRRLCEVIRASSNPGGFGTARPE